jgi:hypothetical protein
MKQPRYIRHRGEAELEPVSARAKYVIHRRLAPETEDLWELVFDDKLGGWCVDHYWIYQETRSRGCHRRSVDEFAGTSVGKRLAGELQEALKRAEQDDRFG